MPYKDKEKRLAYIAEWQAKNAAKVMEYKRKWKQENRDKILADNKQRRLDCLLHYSGGRLECACCQESHYEFLCIDHLNGGGTQHRKSLAHHDFYRYLIQEGYPEGYRVLCHNCNASYGYYGYCPHQGVPNEDNLEHTGTTD